MLPNDASDVFRNRGFISSLSSGRRSFVEKTIWYFRLVYEISHCAFAPSGLYCLEPSPVAGTPGYLLTGPLGLV